MAGPPTPKKGWRAGWGSDHSAQTGQAARGRKEARGAARAPPAPVPGLSLSGRPAPRPGSYPGSQSQWGGGSPLSGVPEGARPGLLDCHDQGPRAPSLRPPQHCPQQGCVPSGSGAVPAQHGFEKPLRTFLLPSPASASSLLLSEGPLLLFTHHWTAFLAQALLASDTGVVGRQAVVMQGWDALEAPGRGFGVSLSPVVSLGFGVSLICPETLSRVAERERALNGVRAPARLLCCR